MGDLISEYRVMRSAAGYYIGEEYYDTEIGAAHPDGGGYWLPWDRLSEYFPERDAAVDILREFVYYDVQDDDEYILCRAYFEDRVSFWHNLENFS